jgi:gas vesicle protein
MKYFNKLLMTLSLFAFINSAHADSIDVSKPEEKGATQWLADKTEDFGKVFSDTGKDISDALASFVGSIWKKTEPERAELKKHAEEKLKEVTKDLDQKVDKAKGILEEQAKIFSKALKEGLDKAEKVLSERSQEMTEELKKELDKLADEIKKQTDDTDEDAKKT